VDTSNNDQKEVDLRVYVELFLSAKKTTECPRIITCKLSR